MANFIINEVTPAQYAEDAQIFQKNLISLFGSYDKKKDVATFTDEDFGDRAEGAYDIAESYGPKIEGSRYVMRSTGAACVSGIIGLMLLRKFPDHVYVDYLATHPLTSGAGFHLMKFARDLTNSGVIKLYDASGSKFYDDLGFTPDETGSMKKTFRGGDFLKWQSNPIYNPHGEWQDNPLYQPSN